MMEYRPEICALKQETEAGIVAVLTPEQAATLEQLQAERRDRWGGRWGYGMPDLDCAATD
jgi:Spy/CpxP family protein refolding chaperone